MSQEEVLGLIVPLGVHYLGEVSGVVGSVWQQDQAHIFGHLDSVQIRHLKRIFVVVDSG